MGYNSRILSVSGFDTGSEMVKTRKELTITIHQLGSGVDLLESIVLTSLDDGKAEQVSVVDLGGKTSFADKMIIANGRSQRHVSSLSTQIVDALKRAGFADVTIEGRDNCDWVLIDAGDIIVHLFRPEMREMYNLEKMWAVAVPTHAPELAY